MWAKIRILIAAVLEITAICLIASTVAHSQSLQAVVGVTSSGTIGSLCQQIQNSVTTVTASASCGWVSSGDGGNGSGTSRAAYGLLQTDAEATQTINFVENDTTTQSGAAFTDSLTFPTLTTNGTLKATVTVSGMVFLSGAVSSTSVSTSMYLGSAGSPCIVNASAGTCTITQSVSPGSQVSFQGAFTVSAAVGPTSGTSSLNYVGKKTSGGTPGARYTVALVDETGHKKSIVSASGTTYPTK